MKKNKILVAILLVIFISIFVIIYLNIKNNKVVETYYSCNKNVEDTNERIIEYTYLFTYNGKLSNFILKEAVTYKNQELFDNSDDEEFIQNYDTFSLETDEENLMKIYIIQENIYPEYDENDNLKKYLNLLKNDDYKCDIVQ